MIYATARPYAEPETATRKLIEIATTQVVISCESGKRNLDDHTEDGWDFDLAILMLAALLCVLGLGIFYLAEREHAPEQSRMIVIGPSDFE
jgi:hypothetical protein